MIKELKASAYDEYLNVAKSVTHAFISLFLFVLPLVITNGYYNITETKLVTFYILSGVYIIIQIFVFLLFVATKGRDLLKSLSLKLNFLDIAFIIFAFSYIVSGVLSEYGAKDVWFGIGSRYQGALTIIMYVLLYFVLTRTFYFSPKCLIWAGAGFSIVSLIALLNGVSFDPLGFYSELSSENQGLYISTIGNINFYSAYYNILLPVLVVGFCKAKDKKSFFVFGSFVVIGSVGMVFTASESFLFGFLVSMVLILAFLMNDKKALGRFLASCCLFIFMITLYTNLYYSDFENVSFNFRPSSLMVLVSNPIIVAVLLFLFACLLIISNKKPRALIRIRKVYCVVLVVALVGCLISIVLINTVYESTDLGTLEEYLKFSDKWGTNRGRNWMFCVNEFVNAPLVSKLFGLGPETYHHLTENTDFYSTKSLDQVHNEYIQYLISVGIWGLGSYLCIIGATIINCFKRIKDNDVATSILCGLIAYWVQAIVNIAQPFTTPIMFVFIAVLCKLADCKNAELK